MRYARLALVGWVVAVLMTVGAGVWGVTARGSAPASDCRDAVITAQARINGLYGYLTGDPRYGADYLLRGRDASLARCG